MPSSEEKRAVVDAFRRSFLEGMLRALVEDGSIEVGNRSFGEINIEYEAALSDRLADPEFDPAYTLRPMFDHEEELLARASGEVNSGDNLIGVTFYVIWLEHFVNGVLIRRFERIGQPRDVYLPMIRTLNIPTKLTSTWTLAGLPPIDADRLKLVNQAIEVRNAFIHYKWPVLTHEEADRNIAQVTSVASQMAELVTYLAGVNDLIFWNGREKEIIDAFRADMTAREAANPPPYPEGL